MLAIIQVDSTAKHRRTVRGKLVLISSSGFCFKFPRPSPLNIGFFAKTPPISRLMLSFPHHSNGVKSTLKEYVFDSNSYRVINENSYYEIEKKTCKNASQIQILLQKGFHLIVEPTPLRSFVTHTNVLSLFKLLLKVSRSRDKIVKP